MINFKFGNNTTPKPDKEKTMATIAPDGSEIREDQVTTVIADDLDIKGTIRFKSSLMIKGTLEGEIISEGLLIVGPTAKVTATITTKNLISHGEIKGDITAGERVVLKNTAVHTGNITTPNVVIESGSVFNGSCIMRKDSATLSATPVQDVVAPTPTPFETEETSADVKEEFSEAPEDSESETSFSKTKENGLF
jgi:cytoskeletal protein CcmA (bactofilin family)